MGLMSWRRLTQWSGGKMQYIKTNVKCFIDAAHKGQNILLVIDTHYNIFTEISGFV